MPKSKKPSDIFPERLKKSREIRDLSQAQVAAKSGLPPSSISHFEAGSRKPSFDNLRRLAVALGVTTDYLVGRVDEPDAQAGSSPLYRDFQNLSDKDRELTREFMKMLASRKQESGGES